MSRTKAIQNSTKEPKNRPARTAEARENQLIALAYDLAEERLRNGTASSAEIVQWMKRGSQKERQELELTKKKMELMQAKVEALQSAKHVEELYGEAILAFRRYNGVFDEGEDIDDGTDEF